jgi:hypothetical protein
MQKLAAIVPGVLIVALGILCGALFNRQRSLEDRLAEVERRSASAPRPAEAPAEKPVDERLPAPPVRAIVEAPRVPADPEIRRPAPVVATPEPLPPALQAAVAKEVERVMKEKRGLWLEGGDAVDPMGVLEKELALSPVQKLRIQEHWKSRDEAFGKVPQESLLKDPLEHIRKMTEIEEGCETAVKRELDFAQQEKYDALKKEGKLLGGAVFRFNVVQKFEKKD